MRVQPGYGETLPALLRRTRGIPERRTWQAAAVVAVLLVIAFFLLRDPLHGKSQRVHKSAPVFNTLYNPALVTPAKPQGDEYQRYVAHRGHVKLAVTVRPLMLPSYRGDVSGVLPIQIEHHIDQLSKTLPGFAVTDEGKARVNKAPGYEVGFNYGPPQHPSSGRDVFVVPFEKPGERRGVIITLRLSRGAANPGPAAKARITAMKSTFRSFKFGADRSD